MLLGRFCETLKATCGSSSCRRKRSIAMCSRELSSMSGNALLTRCFRSSPKLAKSSCGCFCLAWNSCSLGWNASGGRSWRLNTNPVRRQAGFRRWSAFDRRDGRWATAVAAPPSNYWVLRHYGSELPIHRMVLRRVRLWNHQRLFGHDNPDPADYIRQCRMRPQTSACYRTVWCNKIMGNFSGLA